MAAALLHILASATDSPAAPVEGEVRAVLENNTNGRRWKDGTASGQVDRILHQNKTLGAAATDSWNLLAAGSLTDINGDAIDLDELKGIAIKCTSGEVTWQATGANGLDLFKAASDGVVIGNGHTLAMDLGAAGLGVTTNSQFEVTDSGGAGSTYTIWLIGAQ